MPSTNIDRELLETDLDRIIYLLGKLPTGIGCDLEEQQRCALSNVTRRNIKLAKCESREVVEREHWEKLKRELVEFRRRFKELYGS
jgi:hypothetical protein